MLKSILIAGALVGAFALSGCGVLSGDGGTSGSGSAATNSLGDLVTFTKADLDAAESNAIATNNTVVIPCPPALEKWIDATAGAAGQLQVKGLFSGAVAGEAVVNGVQAGIPDYVYTACGPAYMKLHADLYKFIGKSALIGGGL